DGSLTFMGLYQEGSGGGVNLGINGASDLCISLDDQRLYLSSASDHALSVYQRDPESGFLVFEAIVYDGVGGINGLAEASSVQLSPDGQYVYTTGAADQAVTTFSCTYRYDLQESICSGTQFEIAGLTFDESGHFQETLMEGVCTTFVDLDLTLQPSTYEQDVEICTGEIYILGDQAYNTTGVYSESFLSQQGCDSTVIVNLTVVDAFSPTNVAARICEGETYLLGGTAYSTTGNYESLLSSEGGCDSLVQLQLEVVETTVTDLAMTICAGEFVVVGTTNYHTNGWYSQTLVGAAGCDSIVNLLLTIVPDAAILNESICEGDGFEFDNTTYFEAGTYMGTFTTSSGCEVEAILELTVLPELVVNPTVIDDLGNGLGAISLAVSGGQAPYTYQWSNGATQSELSNLAPGVYTVTVNDQINCQEIVDINVNFTTSTAQLDPTHAVIALWPNPASPNEKLQLDLSQLPSIQSLDFQWFNTLGQNLPAIPVTSNPERTTLMSPAQSGIYYLLISDQKNPIQLLRVVVSD
ncbi:MAG: SprB repeat-containing protein, partial [Bacteroidota bacterium]